MSALQGICSPLCDAESGILPGPEWVAALAALSPTPLLIRAGIGADRSNHVHIDAIRAGMRAYRAAGMEPCVVLELSLSRYHTQPGHTDPALLPNAPLGLGGDPMLNDFINRYSLTCASVLNQLGEDGPRTVWISNEPNLAADTLSPGDTQPKPTALAPEVFGALLWTTATRLRTLCPQVTTLWPASFSVLVNFHTGVGGNSPWFEAYWTKAIASLTQHGKHAPWPWEGLCVAMEGAVTQTYADYVFYSLAQVKKKLGIVGPSVVAEYGVPNGSGASALNSETMTTAYTALAGYASHMFFFQAGTMEPDNESAYGAWTWGVVDGKLIVKKKLPWTALLKKLYTEGS